MLASCTQTPKKQLTLSGLDPAKFQTEVNQAQTALYTLKNKAGMEVCITNYGGRIVSIMVPDKNGQMQDVVLGFDSIADYINIPSDFGASIGRYANRINQGRIVLDGDTIQLPQNNFGHCLHGGPKGWQYHVYDAKPIDDTTLQLTRISPDGDENFPGNVTATVVYKLTEDNAIDIKYTATTDKKTVINMTNHSYFNLSGNPAQAATDHILYVNADNYTPVDSTFMTTGEILPVKDTPMDFTTPKAVGQDINNFDFVQLKNGNGKKQKGLLPVRPGAYRRILVVGDNATRNLMLGGGSSELKVKDFISPLDGLRKEFGKVEYAQGYAAGRPMYGQVDVVPQELTDSLRLDAVEKAADADLVIYIGGLNKNMVVVLLSGNAVAMPWLDDVPSVVQTWYLGTITGKALADVLSGDANPSGKLPFTYPVKLEDCPAHHFDALCYPGDSIREVYKEDILVGYRWYDTKGVKPLFPFGYGLSYTSFEYGKARLSSDKMSASGQIELSCTVKNTGSAAGKETVQLYVGDEKCSVLRPVKELKAFRKIRLEPGEEKTVTFAVTPDMLKFFDDKKHEWSAEPGKFKLYVGASSADIRSEAEFVYRP